MFSCAKEGHENKVLASELEDIAEDVVATEKVGSEDDIEEVEQGKSYLKRQRRQPHTLTYDIGHKWTLISQVSQKKLSLHMKYLSVATGGPDKRTKEENVYF